MNKRIWFYVVLLVLIDQFTKWIFYDLKYFQESFFIQAVLNKGISWGIDWFPDFFVMLITGIFIAFLIYYWRKGLVADKVFVLLLAGAIGNLIDRIFW
jgi:lipoprotein signal peptidase